MDGKGTHSHGASDVAKDSERKIGIIFWTEPLMHEAELSNNVVLKEEWEAYFVKMKPQMHK